MFIRAVSTRDRKSGAIYTAHQLVESIRTERGPRQRVVMCLGALDLPKSQWRALAAVLEERLGGQRSLFPAESEVAAVADAVCEHHQLKDTLRNTAEAREAQSERVNVDLNSLATGFSRSLGPELVAQAFFERLGFPEILKSCGFTSYQQDLARAVILGRLLKPGSDLATWHWLREASSLPEFVASDLEKVGKDAVYEIADRLWLHKEALEAGLRRREGALFPAGESIILYDLTNAHFEGRCLGNPLAKRGVSKQKRADCPLVTLALAVDASGFPLFSQIYEGNQSEPQTLPDVLARLKADGGDLFGGVRPTLIMDRGIATSGNLAFLEAEGYPYLVIERRDAAKDFESDFGQAPEGFELVSGEEDGERVYVRKVLAPVDNPEDKPITAPTALLLCYSEGRHEKERGIDTLKETRWLEDLGRLRNAVQNGKLKDPAKIQRRVGRLLERYPSVASQYTVETVADPSTGKITNLVWERLPERQAREMRQGCYVIRTTHTDLAPERIWKLYMTLTRVESAFRALKSDLGFRPVRHHGEARTKGHLFVSVLAYHLLAAIERSLQDRGDHRRWSTLQAQLATHQRTTIHLRGEGQILHQIRISGSPEPVHQTIYRLLDIRDPLKRKRRDLIVQT